MTIHTKYVLVTNSMSSSDMMKITGARWNNDRQYYCVDFDDGITIMMNESHSVVNMLSTGLDSYFLQKFKWPTGKNLEKRKQLGEAWLTRNKRRYKNK